MTGPVLIDDNNDTTKFFLEKIGKIIVVFNHLEFWIDFWIWELVSPSGSAYGRQEIGRRITNSLSFEQKVSLLSSLITERLPEEKIKAFKIVNEKLQRCYRKRNYIVHSQWFIQYGNIPEGIPRTTLTIKYPKKLSVFNKIDSKKYIKTNINEKDLDEIVQEINSIFATITIFFIND